MLNFTGSALDIASGICLIVTIVFTILNIGQGISILLLRNKMKKDEEEKKRITSDGILFCSGMIAGEGLVGILLALLAVFGLNKVIDISGYLNLSDGVAKVAALVVFGLIILSLLKFSVWKKKKTK